MPVRGTYLDMPLSIDDLDGENLEYSAIARRTTSICSNAMTASCCVTRRPRRAPGAPA